MEKTIQRITVAFTVGSFIVFIFLARWSGDFRIALGGTVGLLGVAIYLAVKILEKRKNKALRNRWRSYHIVGCHPETGKAPFMREFHEYCIFVPHKDVHREADKIRAALEKACDGVPKDKRHSVKIYKYIFRLPVNEDAVVEKWEHQEGEHDNSYPARIIRGIEADLKKVEVAQYKAGIDGYCKVELGQDVGTKKKPISTATVIEW